MKDGVYQVKTDYLCAGFVVKGGRIINIAPILVSKFDYWKSIAVKIE